MLASVTASICAAAGAQAPGGRLERILEHARERRSRPADDPEMTPIRGAGDYRFSFVHDGLRREYLVHVPASYRGAPTAVLLALHGGGGDADFQADDEKYGLIGESERAGFIAVFPNGYSSFRSGVLATWNAGRCCGKAARGSVDDVGFLREVIHRVEQQANVDPRRVFVTGMSNGAMMSWRLACEAPEVRAIAPVAGTDMTPDCRSARPVPVIEFHAADDDHVPFGGGRGVGPAKVEMTSVPETQAKWIAIDRAQPQAMRVLAVAGAHCDLHQATRGGAPVELCVTATGGHSWPGGGTQQGRKEPSKAISADDLMWKFFSSLK